MQTCHLLLSRSLITTTPDIWHASSPLRLHLVTTTRLVTTTSHLAHVSSPLRPLYDTSRHHLAHVSSPLWPHIWHISSPLCLTWHASCHHYASHMTRHHYAPLSTCFVTTTASISTRLVTTMPHLAHVVSPLCRKEKKRPVSSPLFSNTENKYLYNCTYPY